MTAPVVVMIVIGLIMIGLSLMISDKDSGHVTDVLSQEVSEQLTNEQMEKVKNKVDELFDSKSEEYIVRTDDELSKASNEKIMAFHEYSEQVLEKIDQNHNEVVFLYDMLNNKEKELKNAIKEVNSTKQEIEKDKGNSQQTPNVNYSPNKNESLKKDRKSEQDTTSKEEKEKQIDEDVAALLNMEDYNEFVEQNNNKDILKMYGEGKSVLEISKTLGIGQGEVKLVVNLYKGINRK